MSRRVCVTESILTPQIFEEVHSVRFSSSATKSSTFSAAAAFNGSADCHRIAQGAPRISGAQRCSTSLIAEVRNGALRLLETQGCRALSAC